jgi:hypothetical protein
MIGALSIRVYIATPVIHNSALRLAAFFSSMETDVS